MRNAGLASIQSRSTAKLNSRETLARIRLAMIGAVSAFRSTRIRMSRRAMS
jgi:hypothetical protein